MEDKTTINNPADILNTVKQFYSDLYSSKDIDRNTDHMNITPSRLTKDEREFLDTPLTKPEIDKALSQQKNNKSPDMDGFSAKFFKRFWPELGYFFMDCVNACFSRGALTQSQSRGLITCLPKTGKARNLLKNWRPISLLNTTYKIISLCITNRLPPILNRIISREQKGFQQ